MLIAIFILPDNLHHSPASLHAQLQVLGLTPVTRNDVFNILVNPFVERYQPLLDYAKREAGEQEDGTKGMGLKELTGLVESIAGKCLEISCKVCTKSHGAPIVHENLEHLQGKLLRKFYDGFPGLLDNMTDMVVEKHQVQVADLPSWEEGDICRRYEAKLCRELPCGLPTFEGSEVEVEKSGHVREVCVEAVEQSREFEGMKKSKDITTLDLVCALDNITPVPQYRLCLLIVFSRKQGDISQESLSTMIRRDEVTPVRSRRRMYFPHSSHSSDSNKLHYPLGQSWFSIPTLVFSILSVSDPLHVGRWVKSYFGPTSPVTAIFMTHAIINDNSSVRSLVPLFDIA
jgi:hypothetical protein